MEEKIVFPGFSVYSLLVRDEKTKTKKVIIGPGIKRDVDDVRAIKCGILKSYVDGDSIVYWIDSHQKRYVAVRGERVMGTVVSKGSLAVNVDIGTSESASLSMLSFEGATKRNRPNIQIGDIVYARVLSANKDTRTELTCVTSRLKKEGLGVLPPGGFMINVPIRLCRRLLSPDNQVIKTLGSIFSYETTIGMNGRIWVRSSSISAAVYVINTFLSVDNKDAREVDELCQDIIKKNSKATHHNHC